ncbi:replication initiator protein [Capybara microvirus Cap1_SP_147]|nr:replication initiator protein [Capybara microvirus Cap1_SP_147]
MCKHPLKAFQYGLHEKSGKPNYIIAPYQCKYIDVDIHDVPHKMYNEPVRSQLTKSIITSFLEIPCGKCIECRLTYARQWANRCQVEADQYEKNCFITLTYSDDYIHFNTFTDPVTGELKKSPTLVKRDIQNFMKRLRKKYGAGIRFFACGEYGETTHRPHYHLILFNHDFNDKKLFKVSRGNPYYISDELSDLWPFGFSMIGDVSWQSCNYVARYITKKQYKKKNEEKDCIIYNYEPEFVLMSRKPGIGLKYYEDNKQDFIRFNGVYLQNGRLFTPPRYFNKKLEIDFGSEYLEKKERNKKIFNDQSILKDELTDLNYLERLQVEEDILLKKTKILHRNGADPLGVL